MSARRIARREFLAGIGAAGAVPVALGAEGATGEPHAILLGTGTEDPHPDRAGPCVAVAAGGAAYLVDAGDGALRRAAEAFRAGAAELQIQHLGFCFLTSLRAECAADLAELMIQPWISGRKEKLQVYGPPGTAAMIRALEEACAAEFKARAGAPEGALPEARGADAHEIREGKVYEDKNAAVTAFRTESGGETESFGYRFDAAGRSIVISGATAPSKNLIEYARGCDLLIHEVYCEAGFVRRSPFAQRYAAARHTSSSQLAALASEARPRRLALYQQRLYGAPTETLLAEIARGYGGSVASGNDLDAF